MKPLHLAVLACCLAAASAAGCNNAPKKHAFEFDAQGWGGPKLKYKLTSNNNMIRIERGMLMNKDFRWAGRRFSFEFLDRRDLVWGFRLLDQEFTGLRRDAFRNTMFKIGDKKYVPGKRLPEDQMWKFDTVVDVLFLIDEKGRSYKVLDAVWYQGLQKNGKLNYRVKATHDVRVRRDTWNTFTVELVGGKVMYWVNGKPGSGTFQVNLRLNGRLGIYVEKGGWLYVRNVKFAGAGSKPGP